MYNYTSSTNDASLCDMKFHLFSFNKVHLKTFVSQNFSLFFSIFPFHRTFSPPYHPAIGSSLGKGSRVDPSKDMVILEQLGSVTQIGCNSPPQGPGWSPQLSQAPWRYGRIHNRFLSMTFLMILLNWWRIPKKNDVMWVSPKKLHMKTSHITSQCPRFCVEVFPDVSCDSPPSTRDAAPRTNSAAVAKAGGGGGGKGRGFFTLAFASAYQQLRLRKDRFLLATTHGLWLLCTFGAVTCMIVHVILSEDAQISQINQQHQINTRLYHESSACFVVASLQRSSGSLNYDLKARRPNERTSVNLPSLSVSTATNVCSGWHQRRFIWIISLIIVFSCKSYTKTILKMKGLSHIAHTNAFSIASMVFYYRILIWHYEWYYIENTSASRKMHALHSWIFHASIEKITLPTVPTVPSPPRLDRRLPCYGVGLIAGVLLLPTIEGALRGN